MIELLKPTLIFSGEILALVASKFSTVVVHLGTNTL